MVPRVNIYHDFTDYAVLVENLLPEILKFQVEILSLPSEKH